MHPLKTFLPTTTTTSIEKKSRDIAFEKEGVNELPKKIGNVGRKMVKHEYLRSCASVCLSLPIHHHHHIIVT